MFIPMAAGAVEAALEITQFLGEFAVKMPGAVETVKLPSHFLDFCVEAAVPVIEPYYARLRHKLIIRILTKLLRVVHF